MDPYLEDPDIWRDFHLTLIVAMRAELNAKLPPGYVTGADRHVTRRDHKGKPYLKITDKKDRRVVTAIELLSPTNKTPGVDRNAYLAKREDYFAGDVNLVEINLLRGGTCPPLGQVHPFDYYLLACRAKELPRASFWCFSVRQPFPDFTIPLRPRDKIVFNLRPCFDRAYQEARYDKDIDYSAPPNLPLTDNDAAWARSLLRSAAADR